MASMWTLECVSTFLIQSLGALSVPLVQFIFCSLIFCFIIRVVSYPKPSVFSPLFLNRTLLLNFL